MGYFDNVEIKFFRNYGEDYDYCKKEVRVLKGEIKGLQEKTKAVCECKTGFGGFFFWVLGTIFYISSIIYFNIKENKLDKQKKRIDERELEFKETKNRCSQIVIENTELKEKLKKIRRKKK
jgi:hypothetical protein